MPLPQLERVLRVKPRLLVLTAPAGYGKTTLAFEYAKTFKSVAFIDLAHTQSVSALLLALLKVLCSHRSDEDAYLRQTQLAVAADDAVPPLLLERVLDAWREPGAPAVVVFDNAESLPNEMLPLLNAILEHRPGYRASVVVSDTPLSLHPATVSSTDTMTLDAAALGLSEEQTRDLFADGTISPEQMRIVHKTAEGWPLLTLLLRALHADDRLSAVLKRGPQTSDREQFYAFIQSEALALLSEKQRRALEFCATVPDVTVDDVRTCLMWQDAEALHSAAATLPLIHIEGNRIHVSPLLRKAMAARNQQAAEDLRNAARAAFRRRDYDCVAARYIACGDREEAVRLLDDTMEHGATAAAASMAALLGPKELDRHPRWSAMATFLRRYDEPPAQSLARFQARRRDVESSGDEAAQFASAAAETALLLHCGFLDRAKERLRELDAFVGTLRRGGILSALRAHVAGRFADTLRGAIAVAACEIERGEQLLKRAPFAIGQYPLISLGALADGWLPIGLFRGDVQLIRHHCERTRESLQRAGLDMMLLDLDANLAFAGWILADESLYKEAIARVDERAPMYRVRALDHFLACAGLRPQCEPTGVEPLRRLIIAHVLAAGRLKDSEGLQHAESALRFAREFAQPFWITLSAIAVRELGGDPACTAAETVTLVPRVEALFLERMRSPAKHSG